MNATEAACILKVSPSLIRRWCREGVLRAEKVDGEWSITRRDVDAVLQPVVRAGRGAA